jgi:hypothetical protein
LNRFRRAKSDAKMAAGAKSDAKMAVPKARSRDSRNA